MYSGTKSSPTGSMRKALDHTVSEYFDTEVLFISSFLLFQLEVGKLEEILSKITNNRAF